MSEPICRCWYDHEQYKITTDCPTHSNNSAVAYLRAEVEELRKDRERLEYLIGITSHPPCDLDKYRKQIDAAIEAAKGGE